MLGSGSAAQRTLCRAFVSVYLCAPVAALAQAGAQAARAAPTTLPLHVHITGTDTRPAVDARFIERQVARANTIFANHDVAFEVAATTRVSGHAALESRADRDALGAHVVAGRLNVFFVTSLRDVDEPERMRRGVHWRSRSHPPAHYIIVSSIAFDEVLAHELGHFLGNHRHSDTPGNLMSYTHTQALPFLDAAQSARLRRTLRRYLRTGELRALAKNHRRGAHKTRPDPTPSLPSSHGSTAQAQGTLDPPAPRRPDAPPQGP